MRVVGWARGLANQINPSRERSNSVSSYQSTGEVNEAADFSPDSSSNGEIQLSFNSVFQSKVEEIKNEQDVFLKVLTLSAEETDIVENYRFLENCWIDFDKNHVAFVQGGL